MLKNLSAHLVAGLLLNERPAGVWRRCVLVSETFLCLEGLEKVLAKLLFLVL